jgi:superoxide reductase
MLRKKSIYKCEVCGNIIESLWNGKTTLSCCGQPMQELVADTVDAAKEKHVPVIEKNGNKVTVKVGSVPHPMQPEHYILFVELLVGDKATPSPRPFSWWKTRTRR